MHHSIHSRLMTGLLVAGAFMACLPRGIEAAPTCVTVIRDVPQAIYASSEYSGDILGVLDRRQTVKVLAESAEFLRVEWTDWRGVAWNGWVPRQGTEMLRELSEWESQRWEQAKAADKDAIDFATRGQYDQAADLLRRVADTVGEIFGPHHPEAIRWRLSYAVRLLDAERHESARKLVLEAIETLLKLNPPDHDGIVAARLLLASSYERSRDSQSALEEYRHARNDHAGNAPRFRRIGKRWLNQGDTPTQASPEADDIRRLSGRPPTPPEVPNATNWTATQFREFLYPHASPGDLALVELEGARLSYGPQEEQALRRGEIRRIVSVRLPWLLLEPSAADTGKPGWVHRESISLLPGGRRHDAMSDQAPPLPVAEIAIVNVDKTSMTFADGKTMDVGRDLSRTILAVTANDELCIRVAIFGAMHYARLPGRDCRRQPPNENAQVAKVFNSFQENGHGQAAIARVSEAAVISDKTVVARLGFGQEVAVIKFNGDEVLVDCQDEGGRVVTGTVAWDDLEPFQFRPQSGGFLARPIQVGGETVPNGLVRQIFGVNGRSVIIATLRQPPTELADPPLLPLSLARVHYARWMQNPEQKSATLEARGILFGETPPHLAAELGLSQPETLGVIAREELRRSIALNPRRPTALMFLGIQLAKQGDFRGADESFTKAIQLNNKNSLAYFPRAQARLRAGQAALAIQDLEKTMQLDPMNFVAWQALMRMKAIQDK